MFPDGATTALLAVGTELVSLLADPPLAEVLDVDAAELVSLLPDPLPVVPLDVDTAEVVSLLPDPPLAVPLGVATAEVVSLLPDPPLAALLVVEAEVAALPVPLEAVLVEPTLLDAGLSPAAAVAGTAVVSFTV